MYVSSMLYLCRDSDVSQQMWKWPIIFSLIFSSKILTNLNVSEETAVIYQFVYSFRWSSLFFQLTFLVTWVL